MTNAAAGTATFAAQYAVAARTAMGLSADTASIAAAASNSSATSSDLGTPITPAEHSALLARDELSREAYVLLKQAQANGVHAYNVIRDPAQNTQIDVIAPGDGCAVLSQVQALAPSVPMHLVSVPNAVDQAEADVRLQTIDANIGSLSGVGIQIDRAGVDPISGVLNIAIPPSAPRDAEALIGGVVGTTGVDVVRNGAPLTTADSNYPSDIRYNSPYNNVVMWAGQLINDVNGACSSNFQATNGTAYYVVTAAHCFLPPGDPVGLGDAAMSDTSTWEQTDSTKSLGGALEPGGQIYFPGKTYKCDCEAIGPIPSSSLNTQAITGTNVGRTYNYVAYNEADFKGGPGVCTSGITTAKENNGGMACGYLDGASQTVLECDANGRNCSTLTDALTMVYFSSNCSLTAGAGDSGGPALHGGNQLLGILDAGGPDPNDSSFCEAFISKAKNITGIYPKFTWVGLVEN